MAITHAAAEYVFSDFLLKEPGGCRLRGVRLELAVDKMVTLVSAGLPLLLISLAFAQEISVGTQISCFSPSSFSWRQAAYVDAYCWASLHRPLPKHDAERIPLWLHKVFPYVLLLVAILMYVPALFWQFTAAPQLYGELTFIIEELDKAYNRGIRLAQHIVSTSGFDANICFQTFGEQSGAKEKRENFFQFPIVERYLKSKEDSWRMLTLYLIRKGLAVTFLILACIYLGYYISLTSLTDEFRCSVKTGILGNETSIPDFFQCKLISVGIFQLLSIVNIVVYILLTPVAVYSMIFPLRKKFTFLKVYELLPQFEVMNVTKGYWNDLNLYLLFLEENISEIKSHKCLKVLEHIKGKGLLEPSVMDAMMPLIALGQVKSDTVDGLAKTKKAEQKSDPNMDLNTTQLKDIQELPAGQRMQPQHEGRELPKATDEDAPSLDLTMAAGSGTFNV
ncbi:pannexin-1a isoform X1 [Carcharodon carcharias]|uniref:pannexin-1a isoform X1 n=1 Tax=Carcharodon carcharias TaxID=13397 RepID=UPI001B7EED1C|nr:pannexin-1a isoform X1 [Carcharodon carcharias]